MSDGEEAPPSPPAEATEVEVPTTGGGSGQMSVIDALKGVLKVALIHDGLARGLREASKALDRRQAHMCVLNEACEEEAYKKLVVALCGEHKIPLIKVPNGKELGEWAGLCQIDREGNARKVVNCSCVVVKDWGEESSERSVLLNYFQTDVMETVTAAIAADPNFTTVLAAAISSVMAGGGAHHQAQPTPRGSVGVAGDGNGGAGAASAAPTAAAHATSGGSPRCATQSCTTSTT